VERRPIERVRGTQDLGTRAANALDAIRTRCESRFSTHGFRRVDVPVIELAELHLRKSGLETISKLYAFHDLGGRRICLRPELTASIVRAAIASPAARLPDKVFATGPVFRYERPSRGRFRQFVQTGVEVLGAEGPLADAEVIALAATTLDDLGISEYSITIGNVGILSDVLGRLGLTGRRRAILLESLEETRRHGIGAVRKRLETLDPDAVVPRPASASNLTNPSAAPETIAQLIAEVSPGDLGRRTLDDVATRLVARMQGNQAHEAIERALAFIAQLGEVRGDSIEALAAGRALLDLHGLDMTPLAELAQTVELLGAFGVDRSRLRIDLGLSRGLQYYTGMVFEMDHASLGAERQLCGGGRYDDLVRVLGGRQSVPATGFAFGLERLVLAREAEAGLSHEPAPATVFIVPASPHDVAYAIACAVTLRQNGIWTALDTSGRGVRAAVTFAAREGFPAVAVVSGDDPPATCRPRALREGAAGAGETPLEAPMPIPFDDVAAWLNSQGIVARNDGQLLEAR
jgi:histidyl-tRNA synthetase